MKWKERQEKKKNEAQANGKSITESNQEEFTEE
jgi:hypothetical protein